MNNREGLVDFFLTYNREHLKSVTKSLEIMSEKFGMSKAKIRKILGREVFEQMKTNPSVLQDKVLKMVQDGKCQSEIAKELKMSRQAVFIAIDVAKEKGLVG